MLKDDIKKAKIDAMKAHDKNASGVLGVVLNKVMLAEIELRAKGAELKDSDVIAVLQKAEKELQDERQGFEKAGRAESVAALDAQIAIVKGFLPQMMSADEIAAVINSLPDKSVPAVMKHFKAEYAGKCDMRLVSEVLKKING